MKISKLFHWLYASLMLLPFASVVSTTLYYSFNKNAIVPSVDKEVSKEVNFNQQINLVSYVETGYVDLVVSNNDQSIVINGGGTDTGYIYRNVTTNFTLYDGHTYVGYANGPVSSDITFYFNTGYVAFYTPTLFVWGYNGTDISQALWIQIKKDAYYTDFTCHPVLFDLTAMFGVGNEPSLSDFLSYFPAQYYDYTLTEHIVIPNYETIQVTDNSINHFWLPSFGAIGYNIQSYIGWLIGNIFGLNVVNGIGFVIVRLFTYWLIISICWLIFDVLMYVPNLVHKWLDKAAID